MNKLFKPFTLWVLTAVALFTTACAAQVVQPQRAKPAQPPDLAAPQAATYDAVLGKSLNDREVADFLASNHCSGTPDLQTCNAAGMAVWIGLDRKVKTVALFLGKSPNFGTYKGNLPFGLTAGDTMADVEQKFGQPKVEHAPQAGWEPGLPDESATPDHIHYWAIYKRFGVTVVYNSPMSTDKQATISEIFVSK